MYIAITHNLSGHVRRPSSASYLESFLPTKVGPPITMRHISKKARGCLHVPVYPSQVTEWPCENCRAHLNAMMDALRCRRHRNSREAPRRTYNSKQNPIFYIYETHWAQSVAVARWTILLLKTYRRLSTTTPKVEARNRETSMMYM